MSCWRLSALKWHTELSIYHKYIIHLNTLCTEHWYTLRVVSGDVLNTSWCGNPMGAFSHKKNTGKQPVPSPCHPFVNSLAPLRCGCNIKFVIFLWNCHRSMTSKSLMPTAPSCLDGKFHIYIYIYITFIYDGAVDARDLWVPNECPIGCHKLSLVTAPSHYLSQCWHRSLSPHDVIRPQRVKPCVRGKTCSFAQPPIV